MDTHVINLAVPTTFPGEDNRVRMPQEGAITVDTATRDYLEEHGLLAPEPEYVDLSGREVSDASIAADAAAREEARTRPAQLGRSRSRTR